jgi:hypothetical protein
MTRIAATIVGTDENRFRSVTANDERFELARSIAAYTQGDGGANIVMLPAGFLTAADEDEARKLAKKLASIFNKPVLLAGIDEKATAGKGGKGSSRSSTAGKGGKSEVAADSSEGYPYWAFASESGKVIGGPWRQRTALPGQTAADTTARCVRAGDLNIGLLICGELYNPALAESLAQAKPDLVVDLAHLSMKRFTKSLARVATTVGRNIYHVQHVTLTAAHPSKWRATRKGGAQSDTRSDWESYNQPDWKSGDLWAEVKIWKL